MIRTLIVAVMLASLGGCLADDSSRAVRTIGEIQKSEYRAEYNSAKSVDVVSRCMMQTLDGYRTEQNTHPYAGVELLKAGPNQEMTLIMPSRPVAGKSRPEAELLFLIENLRVETGGTRSRIWVNPTIHSPAPQVSLNMLSNIVKACL